MIRRSLLALTVMLASPGLAKPPAIPTSFTARGADRVAIDQLLATYTKAVSTKDQPLFETLLLDRDIPFTGIGKPLASGAGAVATRRYDDFRSGVFAGPPFTQHFRNIDVRQDGPLATVDLVFVNTAADGTSWGWKTLQLVKVADRWKIASEFYTNHG